MQCIISEAAKLQVQNMNFLVILVGREEDLQNNFCRLNANVLEIKCCSGKGNNRRKQETRYRHTLLTNKRLEIFHSIMNKWIPIYNKMLMEYWWKVKFHCLLTTLCRSALNYVRVYWILSREMKYTLQEPEIFKSSDNVWQYE